MIRPFMSLLFAGLCLLPAERAAAQRAEADQRIVSLCLEKAEAARSFGGECVGIVADPCIKAAAGTAEAEQACAAREEAVWRRRIDEALKRIRAGGFGEVTAAVAEAQKSWAASRERLCPALGRIDPGMYPGGSTYCRLQENARRALTLMKLGAALNEH